MELLNVFIFLARVLPARYTSVNCFMFSIKPFDLVDSLVVLVRVLWLILSLTHSVWHSQRPFPMVICQQRLNLNQTGEKILRAKQQAAEGHPGALLLFEACA